MKNSLDKIIKKIFRWVFREELNKLEKQIVVNDNQIKSLNNLLQNIDVSVDHHQYSRSWAVISIQGHRSDYVKFVDLGERDMREIQKFLRYFDRDRIKIDAPYPIRDFLKFKKQEYK